MKFSLLPQRKKLDKTKVGALAMINLLVTPGAGSVMGGRWVGYPQMALAFAGFLLICWFFYCFIMDMLHTGAVTELRRYGPYGLYGALGFGIAWFWSLITSISMWLEAARKKREAASPGAAQPGAEDDGANCSP